MSTSSAASNPDNPGGHLPTTTTFLPILDDLLSPDFRPVTYPPVVTPLQTPTTATTAVGAVQNGGAGSSSNNCKKVVMIQEDQHEAAEKIQKWWKSSSRGKGGEGGCGDADSERAKVALRHRRAEEHIRALESEVLRLKSSLATERKLRSLQYEAIRSLWSQVQKLTVNNPGCVELQQQASHASPPSCGSSVGMMTQSLPNGLPNEPVPTQTATAVPPPHCNCATEFGTVVRKLEDEIADLRALIVQNLGGSATKEIETGGSGTMDSSTTSSAGSTKVNKRPDSLDLNGSGGGSGNGGSSSGNRNAVNAKPEELQGYANEMAKFVVERGISDNLDQSCGGGSSGAGGE